MSWADWLNLESLILTSRAIVAASEARQESRGAHWREDFPQTDDDAKGLRHTLVTLEEGAVKLDWREVRFTRLKPGQSLLATAAE